MPLKRILCCAASLLLGVGLYAADNTDDARQVLQRVIGKQDLPVKLKINRTGDTYFDYEVHDGILNITASDNVSLCRGFYDYVKTHNLGMFTWSGNNINLPSSLPSGTHTTVISPFTDHYYFNVCTYGYSMP